MNRPIALGLAPNVEKIDALAALQLLLSSKKVWVEKEDDKLAAWFRNYFLVPYAFPFTSARGGITAILKALGVEKEDEVLLQAFTCVAVSNAVIASGATPVYVDITRDFGMDIENVKKKITPKTKAIILQHTFGIPSINRELESLLKENKIFVIEDVAHGIGGTYKGKKLGIIGDAAVFSFGRDKAFSSVSGGIVITKNKKIGEYIKELYGSQPYPSSWWIFQQLFHTVSFYFLILPFYNLFLGKVLLFILQKLHLLSKPVDKNELQHFSDFTKKLPPQLAFVILLQLRRLDRFNTYREETSEYYAQELTHFHAKKYPGVPLLRYPLLARYPQKLKSYAKKRGVLLGDWYSNIIDPKGIETEKVGYKHDCPQAAYIAAHIINLPTYPTLTRKDREKVVKIIKEYGKN